MHGSIRFSWATLSVVLLSFAALRWADSGAAAMQVVPGFERCKVVSVTQQPSLLTHGTKVVTDHGEFTVYGAMPVAAGEHVALQAGSFGQKSLCKGPAPASCFRLSAD